MTTMGPFGERMEFRQTVRQNYGGHATFQVDAERSEIRLDSTNRISHAHIVVRLCIGTPQTFDHQLVYPVETTGLGTYQLERDGEMSWRDVARFALRRALDNAWIGASALLNPTNPNLFF